MHTPDFPAGGATKMIYHPSIEVALEIVVFIKRSAAFTKNK